MVEGWPYVHPSSLLYIPYLDEKEIWRLAHNGMLIVCD